MPKPDEVGHEAAGSAGGEHSNAGAAGPTSTMLALQQRLAAARDAVASMKQEVQAAQAAHQGQQEEEQVLKGKFTA